MSPYYNALSLSTSAAILSGLSARRMRSTIGLAAATSEVSTRCLTVQQVRGVHREIAQAQAEQQARQVTSPAISPHTAIGRFALFAVVDRHARAAG